MLMRRVRRRGRRPSSRWVCGRRLLRALVWVRSRPGDNQYAHPVAQFCAIVDLDEGRVADIEDHEVVPIPWEEGNYFTSDVGARRTDVRPLDVVQPEGPSFTVDGNLIRWQNWDFHYGFTAREGLVLHAIGLTDHARRRSVMHRASMAEMFVPYGDASPIQYRKNAFDAGEYLLGVLANELKLGCDCLGHIHYFDAVVNDGLGRPRVIKNAICLHEEDHGILWKHTDWRTNIVEMRRGRRLVISFIATVGNYEYSIYWYLYQDGTTRCSIRLGRLRR